MMNTNRKILLVMPPFWDPICPPQGIVSLKAFLQARGHEVHIDDFNTDGPLFALQKKYFEHCLAECPHWKLLSIFRNGPRYFSRHQMVFLRAGSGRGAAYKRLIGHILNIDGKSFFSDKVIDALDAVINESFNVVLGKAGQLLSRIQPDVIGCTMLESTLPMALLILKRAKEMYPGIKTVLGGPGAVVGNMVDDGNLENIVKKCPWIDTIMYGEGEQIFDRYLQGLWEDKKIIVVKDLGSPDPGQDLKSLLLDVDAVPAQDYEGLAVHRYLWLSLFTSRGCPYKCAFCFENSYWTRFRPKDVQRIVSEITMLSERYGKDKFYLCDSLANHIATSLSEALLKENKKYRWDSYMRVTDECLDPKKAELWASGGLDRVRIGVESASPRVLKLMNKGISPAKTKACLENLARHGIQTTTLWIAGFPGETEQDFQESIDFMVENKSFIYQADIWEFVCSPTGVASAGPGEADFSTKPIYPEEFDELLILKYYDLKNGPSGSERFDRITRFEEARINAGISNPYTMQDLVRAHQRWVKLGHQKEGHGPF